MASTKAAKQKIKKQFRNAKHKILKAERKAHDYAITHPEKAMAIAAAVGAAVGAGITAGIAAAVRKFKKKKR